MPTQFVEFTLPLEIDGWTICEIDAAVEVRVTDKGKAASYYSPAEGPEWECESFWVYTTGEYDPEARKVAHKWLHAPADIAQRIEDYVATTKGREIVSDAIREDA
tara:strand:- start:561 stop:875 length:315 start_codon:yes stop_codon:yes gene_type:complete